jgi:hypothetical protein
MRRTRVRNPSLPHAHSRNRMRAPTAPHTHHCTTTQAEDALVASVRAEMAAMASAHAQRVAALETRLAWFAENQRLLGDGDALIAEQVGCRCVGAFEVPRRGVQHGRCGPRRGCARLYCWSEACLTAAGTAAATNAPRRRTRYARYSSGWLRSSHRRASGSGSASRSLRAR